jgi:hypothetical protein
MEIIDDLTPTADEEIWNGLDTEGTSNETPVGRASLGNTGFNYTYSAIDGVQVDVGYSPKSSTLSNDDGALTWYWWKKIIIFYSCTIHRY